MSERKTNQTFVYTGGIEYSFNNVILDGKNGVAPYLPLEGYGGIGPIPNDGDTVTMRTGDIGLKAGVKDLQPTMNNKFFYLVTDELYDKEDIETVKDLATEVSVAIVSGKYEGTFVFSNPNNYENLYLIWDYADNMDGGTASYSGGEVTKYVDIDFEGKLGVAGVDYVVTDTPARILLKNGSSIVADTGYVGLNTTANYDDLIAAGVAEEDINLTEPYDGLVNNGTGSLLFQKKTVSIDSKMIVESPLPGTSWALTTVAATRTLFYVDLTERDTAAETETDCPTYALYHDGFSSLPQPGDTIYRNPDPDLTATAGSADTAGKYFLMDSVLCTGTPAATSRWFTSTEFGVVTNTGNPDSTCLEVAAPTITQIDIEMLSSTYVDMCLEASNNPTSWEIISSFNNYEIDGGGCGVIYEYTNYNGETVTDVIGKNLQRLAASTSLPVITSGTGTVTLIGANPKGSIPQGLTLNTTTGNLSGTPLSTGIYTLTAQATNCFGTSVSEDIVITVVSSVKMTAFGIASEEAQATSALAIALSPSAYTVMYHLGSATLPIVGDMTYANAEGTEVIIGNSQWYRISNSASAYQIDATGRVISIV